MNDKPKTDLIRALAILCAYPGEWRREKARRERAGIDRSKALKMIAEKERLTDKG